MPTSFKLLVPSSLCFSKEWDGRHTCVLDVLQALVGVAISGSEGRVHADDVTMPAGLDSLHAVSLC